MAAFSQRSSLKFELAADNPGDHRIRLSDAPGLLNEQTRNTIQVEAAPLDEIVGPIDDTLAIKIDTEGAEPFVIEGGRKTFEQADLVILEFWPYAMTRMGGDPERVIRYLEENFEIMSMSREEKPLVDHTSAANAAADLRRFVETKSKDYMFYVDVVASRHT